ncbi:hypothetical protein Q4601_08480 [Shewanella sp. 1_MG-2023]|uniref:Spore coat protein U domain-containing protein n=1 Tax=Shewanella electrodiphila TaxID=934143 RepID=A0ABT0KL83_9GAMM|nr:MULTISPECIES: hypothetical protein [Shewanella]MCL1044597.1 hypothetical protein [Shewanella electrodiphila]MDO6610328.1 hypothetical protein [Shewanella sp. 7_MG-2023]MDO6770453.1 hypothetical protein [Shewanella sp. 2_MG-2023]MDO6794340.1 hypothetical protein [Shewanella sp. 1_MG-2023]PMG78775.1 hypothetical protein BCU84_00745 [Shewanella sp. 10N.286.51.B7]
MKKYTLAAAAVATLFVGSASAVEVNLSGNIQEVCEASATQTSLSDMSTTTMSGFSFVCNDRDGATVTITSAEGGLQGIDSEDLVIPYVATLSVGGFGDLILDLTTGGNTGTNDASQSRDFTGAQLLNGAAATLEINFGALTTGTGAWAGAYYDQLTIQISAI